MVFKFLLTPGAGKEAALVGSGIEANFEDRRQLAFREKSWRLVKVRRPTAR